MIRLAGISLTKFKDPTSSREVLWPLATRCSYKISSKPTKWVKSYWGQTHRYYDIISMSFLEKNKERSL